MGTLPLLTYLSSKGKNSKKPAARQSNNFWAPEGKWRRSGFRRLTKMTLLSFVLSLSTRQVLSLHLLYLARGTPNLPNTTCTKTDDLPTTYVAHHPYLGRGLASGSASRKHVHLDHLASPSAFLQPSHTSHTSHDGGHEQHRRLKDSLLSQGRRRCPPLQA